MGAGDLVMRAGHQGKPVILAQTISCSWNYAQYYSPSREFSICMQYIYIIRFKTTLPPRHPALHLVSRFRVGRLSSGATRCAWKREDKRLEVLLTGFLSVLEVIKENTSYSLLICLLVNIFNYLGRTYKCRPLLKVRS